ncbi:MAG TPA: ABC transporter ATP-binding protein [Caldimonas sp.]|nr:ABC transporter ATP-binding protein [Caldimonas sp.]
MSGGAIALDTFELTKRFGAFTAMDRVTVHVAAGSVHALLGENGAGKSTLVKCVAGSQRPDGGSVLLDGREHDIATPIVARALGIGMVYQHFTLAPGMTVAENLLLAGGRTPAVIDWSRQRRELEAFLDTTPFRLDLDVTPAALAAGEKQKLELLKQLYLKPRLLILDEPTSVLTPQEADEVLAFVRAVAHRGECTVLMITHKFREVMAYADDVTVLRRGRRVFGAAVNATTPSELAQAMIGAGSGGVEPAADVETVVHEGEAAPRVPVAHDAPVALAIEGLSAMGDRGTLAVRSLSLSVRRGEVLGIAGVSGNGQRELVEAIVGQRPRAGGTVTVVGSAYEGRRGENSRLKLRALPEEPLRNASVGALSVGANMALRDFERPPLASHGWLRFSAWRTRARAWIADYGIQTRGEGAPIASLSGGNVQRAVLARELAGTINVLIAANPVFGLDFAAVREIHARILDVRAAGGAVLLVSEDLDELLELSDRIAVMSEGRIVFETSAAGADRRTIGAHMGGHAHEPLAEAA